MPGRAQSNFLPLAVLPPPFPLISVRAGFGPAEIRSKLIFVFTNWRVSKRARELLCKILFGGVMNRFRSTKFRQLLATAAVLLVASLPCSAQKGKPFAQEPALDAHDQASVQRMLHIKPTTARPPRAAVGTPVHSEPQALPHWSGSFTVTTGAGNATTRQTYPYTMVGTDPSTGGTSNTTTVRTILVPLRLQFADGTVFDASTDIVAPLGTSAINNILNSPQFTSSPTYSGGVNLGNTQYADAVQRGNLWNKVSKKPDYHVLLKPEVYPTQTVVVPAGQGATHTDYRSGVLYGVVNDEPTNSNSYQSAVDVAIQNFVAQVNDPSALLIFVSHNIVACSGGCLGFHDVLSVGGGMEQTYIYASYNDPTLFAFPYYNFAGYPDINDLSHEVSEWVNDPFGDNIVPAWNNIGARVPASERGFHYRRCSTFRLRELCVRHQQFGQDGRRVRQRRSIAKLRALRLTRELCALYPA